MNIDFAKLVVLLLPTRLRMPVLAFFIESCIEPLKLMYNNLIAWGEDKRLEQVTNWQVCQLESYLNKVLVGDAQRRDIFITDGDGFTRDFVVNITEGVIVDELRLKAIVDKFKLLGTRYNAAGSARTYAFNWVQHVEELNNAGTIATWIEHVEEAIDRKLEATLMTGATLNYFGDGSLRSITIESTLETELNAEVHSDITARILVTYSQGGSSMWFNISLPAGQRYMVYEMSLIGYDIVASEIYSIEYQTASPTTDDEFNYTYGVQY